MEIQDKAWHRESSSVPTPSSPERVYVSELWPRTHLPPALLVEYVAEKMRK